MSLLITAVALVIRFAQSVLAARVLGAEQLGIAAVVISAATFIAVFGTMGLNRLAVRLVAAMRETGELDRLRGFLRFAPRAVGLASLAIAALLLIASVSGVGARPEYTPASLVAGSVLTVFVALLALNRGEAQGLGSVVLAQTPDQMLRPGLQVAVLLASLAAGWAMTAQDYLIATLACFAITWVLARTFLARKISDLVPEGPGQSEPAAWIRQALPYLGMALVMTGLSEINTLLLGWLAGPREAGLYQPIARIAPLMVITVVALGVPFEPRLAALWAAGEHPRVHRLTAQVALANTLATLASIVVILLAAPWILAAFGPEFVVVMPALWWIAAAQVVNAAFGPVGFVLAMTGRPGAAIQGQLAGLVVNAGVGVWLIPDYGALGAAIALSAGIVTWNAMMHLRVRRDVGFDPSVFSARQLLVREG